MTNTIADIEEADVILITGSNTSENHPVLSSFVKRAVTRRGAKLIVVDPRRIKMTEFAEQWLRPNLGTDVAWINGMMHVIIKEDLHDKTFIEERTENFEALKAVVDKYTPEHVESITGIPAQQLIDAARLYAKAPAGSILYCMGITQHTTGTDNVKSPGQPGHALRQPGHPGRRGQSAARPEQRPGGLRHGRPAQRAHRLSVGGQPGCHQKDGTGLERHRPAHQTGTQGHGNGSQSPQWRDSRPCTSSARTRWCPIPT